MPQQGPAETSSFLISHHTYLQNISLYLFINTSMITSDPQNIAMIIQNLPDFLGLDFLDTSDPQSIAMVIQNVPDFLGLDYLNIIEWLTVLFFFLFY